MWNLKPAHSHKLAMRSHWLDMEDNEGGSTYYSGGVRKQNELKGESYKTFSDLGPNPFKLDNTIVFCSRIYG